MLAVIRGKRWKNSSFIASDFSVKEEVRLLLRQKRVVERGFEKSDKDSEGLQNSGKR